MTQGAAAAGEPDPQPWRSLEYQLANGSLNSRIRPFGRSGVDQVCRSSGTNNDATSATTESWMKRRRRQDTKLHLRTFSTRPGSQHCYQFVPQRELAPHVWE
jgi:hypothetical protein